MQDSDADLKQIFEYIMHELGQNIFLESTTAFFVDQVNKIVARGVQGVILGCTEIELVIQNKHVPGIDLFYSADLHITAAAEVEAGLLSYDAFVPPS